LNRPGDGVELVVVQVGVVRCDGGSERGGREAPGERLSKKLSDRVGFRLRGWDLFGNY
jgi:hypothetical protein